MDQTISSDFLSIDDKHRDNLFASSHYPKPFCFNEDVAQVFDDMVKRSIPSYSDVSLYLIAWVQSFFQPEGAIIDIGCSTGTTLSCIARILPQKARLIGYDNAPAMIERARAKLGHLPKLPFQHDILLECADITTSPIPTASIVIMNYTLQFLPVGERLKLLKRIYDSLLPGGLFFISEKLRSEHPRLHEMKTRIYEQFKKDQGYSQNEIERKKEALENVLVPHTEPELIKLIEKAGFTSCESAMKWNNFASFVAFKET